jgi:hypothetical protein
MSRKMYKSVHRMQSEKKTDTKVVSETERFGLGTCRIEKLQFGNVFFIPIRNAIIRHLNTFCSIDIYLFT